MTNTIKVQGTCDGRFSSVKQTFADNFQGGSEVGASFAATINGRYVVDIWRGYADAADADRR